jgi:Ca2+-binding RTX toxin-like protein
LLTGLSVSTADHGTDDADTFTATLYVEHGTLSVGSSHVTISGGDGHDSADALVITGSLANVNAALLAVTYTPTSEYEGTDTVHFTATSTEDVGTSASTAAVETTAAITVNGIADTPVISVPNVVTTDENASKLLTGLSVSTADHGTDDADTFTATLYVEHGTLSLGEGLHATISGGDGSAAAHPVVITGSLADVNAALAAVTYTPAREYEGTDTVHFTATSTEDVGTSTSAAATETTAAITVAPVAHQPLVSASATEIDEGGTSHLTINFSNAADLFENSDADDSVVVTVSLSGDAVLHGDSVINHGDGIFTLTAKSASDLSDLTITPTSEFEGAIAVGVSAIAHDGTAVSAAGTATTTLTVNENDGPTHVRQTHLPPVIDTTHFEITQNKDGTTTITGLQVTDADPQVASETFTVSASAQHGDVKLHSNEQGHLNQVNSDLSAVTYAPGAHPPANDAVTLTVADSFGNSDTVHFVFNETGAPGEGNKITLTGTSGKDVIIATGYDDNLTGGAGADQFVFAPNKTSNHDTITDFAPGQDHLDIRAFQSVDSTSIGNWLKTHASTTKDHDTLLTLDSNDSILLKNVSSLHASDFIVTPHSA